METLTILGTGAAMTTKCYNTCFTISHGDEHFLVDGGGGNTILSHLEKCNISLSSIHHIFVSHNHTDHVMGIIWVIRAIGHRISKGSYHGNLTIYCHDELAKGIQAMGNFVLPKSVIAHFNQRIFIEEIHDHQQHRILNQPITFFDLYSTKDKQFGFTMTLSNGKQLTYLGDEPYHDHNQCYAEDVDFLLHEALCLEKDKEIFQPHKIHHATVKDAAINGQQLGAKTLILYHTEDTNLATRKVEYTKEAKQYFTGTIVVPDDLEIITLE